MPPPRRERISGVDTSWLRMDLPTNLMVIVGVLIFEGRLEVKQLKRTLENRFLAFRRFRQKAVQDSTGAWWEDDEAFDIDSHVHRVALPGKGGKAELQAFVSDLASTPLDFTKPLWQYHLVENYDGGSALVMRIHHCYADGIAMVQVMLSMTETTAKGSLALPPEEVEPAGSAEADFWEQILKPVTGALEGASRVGRSLLDQGKELAANPVLAQEALEGVTRKGMDFAGETRAPRADGQRLGHALQGPPGREQARGLGGAPAAGRGQGDGQGAGLLHQRRPAVDGHGRAAELPRVEGRRGGRHRDPRDRAGEPAPRGQAAASWATSSASCSSSCPSRSTIRSSASTRCAGACRRSRAPTSRSSSWDCCTRSATARRSSRSRSRACFPRTPRR